MAYFTCVIALCILAIANCYELGMKYRYDYETTVTIDEACVTQDVSQVVGENLKMKIDLANIWENPQNAMEKIIKLEISNIRLLLPKKSSMEFHSSILDKLDRSVSYLHWIDGKCKEVLDDPAESVTLKNIKRGILSFLQLQKVNQQTKELDLAGECIVDYKIEGDKITKRKINCLSKRTRDKYFDIRSASIYQSSNFECDMKNIDKLLIKKCQANDLVKIFSNLWTKPSICVNSKSILELSEEQKFNEILKEVAYEKAVYQLKSINDNLEEGNFHYLPFNEKSQHFKPLTESLKQYQESLKTSNLAKVKSASVFYKLFPAFHFAKKDDILKVLGTKKFKVIMPQILDIIAASGNDEALKAVFEKFDFVKDDQDLLERFLISLSVSPRSSAYSIKQIMALLEMKGIKSKMRATLAATLGSIIKNDHDIESEDDEKVNEEAKNYLIQKTQQCTEDDCIFNYLRGLRNTDDPSLVPLMLEYISRGNKVAFESLLALKKMSHKVALPLENQQHLLNVLLQDQQYDRSARTIAADILLGQNPNRSVLKRILSTLLDQKDPEFSTFLASKIIQKISLDEKLRSMVYEALRDKELGYYYPLAQKGSSSMFIKPLLSAEGINITYGVEMEMLEGSLLKRSSFDVNIENSDGATNLLTVGMFAEGMASLAGSSSQSDEDPSAGMELTLLSSSLRPYVFFTGTSELMSHAWSGTASELTPALQGNFLFCDDKEVIVLNNGLVVDVQLHGVLSVDLSASIQISLWNRDSQSLVKNAAALLVRGKASIVSDFAQTVGEFSFSGQSAIDFNTNLEFYDSPFKMCLQMSHPDITLKHDILRRTSVMESTYLVKKSKKRTRKIPGRSYALNRQNNEQCQIMLTET